MSALQLLQPSPPSLQTFVASPNTVARPPPSSSQQHSHSSGSFGTVFLVLAVILVVSAIACCLGRFCNRRSRNGDHHPQSKQNHRPRPRENDIEFGFDGRTQAVANPTAGNKEGSQMIHDKDKPGLGPGFQFQTRANVEEPKPGA